MHTDYHWPSDADSGFIFVKSSDSFPCVWEQQVIATVVTTLGNNSHHRSSFHINNITFCVLFSVRLFRVIFCCFVAAAGNTCHWSKSSKYDLTFVTFGIFIYLMHSLLPRPWYWMLDSGDYCLQYTCTQQMIQQIDKLYLDRGHWHCVQSTYNWFLHKVEERGWSWKLSGWKAQCLQINDCWKPMNLSSHQFPALVRN